MGLMFPIKRLVRQPAELEPHRTPVRHRPSLDFSLTGLVYCSMMMFMGLAAINTQANLLFGVFGLMIGILLVSGIISRLVLRQVRISRDLPEHAVVGLPAIIGYRFENGKRFWPSFSISLAELNGVEGFVHQPQSYLLHAAARNTALVPARITPKRRGLHRLSRYQISTSFPFGFIKRAREREHDDQLLAYPALAGVSPRLLQMCQPAEKTGPTMRPRRGGMDEFYGLKEHRRGENPRFIHWRRSARTGVLVAREMTQVAPPRLLILVDTFLPLATRATAAEVERVIAMAGSLASSALEKGLSVGVHGWTGEWAGIYPTRGKRQRRDLLTFLACLPYNDQKDAQSLLENARDLAESGTTLALVTPSEASLSLADTLRGNLVVVMANSPQAQSWFTFPPGAAFDRCMPEEVENHFNPIIA